MMAFPLNPSLKSFCSDESGGIAIMFGLMSLGIMMFAGVALDYSRVNHERSRVTAALDAAALAAGKALLDGRLTDTEVQQRARAYFEQNVKAAQRFGSVESFDVQIDRATSGVQVNAAVALPMTLTRLMGIDNVVFPVSASAKFEQQDIELSLALDVTGSMAGSKIAALKAAAQDLFDILLPDAGTPNKVRIALAPYSSGVNAGVYAATATGLAAPARGCTFEREGPDKFDDSAPEAGNYFKAIGSSGIVRGASCPSAARVVALTDDKDVLRTEVQSYTVGGSTAGHLGAQWAWNLISPNWGSVFTGDNTPVSYGDRKTLKVMIVMTDGRFNTFAGQNLGDNSSTARRSSKLAVAACEGARDKGIAVYTIGFQLDDPQATQTLKDCAGNDRNFYAAATGEELREVFKSIAEQIISLRLSS